MQENNVDSDLGVPGSSSDTRLEEPSTLGDSATFDEVKL